MGIEAVRWTAAAVVFVVTLELCLRIESAVRWDAPLLRAYSHEALFVNDSLGWHPRPGARFEKWTINSHGFRGPEIEREKAPGIVRVAVLGSSETFGQSEGPGMEFPRALERRLNEAVGGETTGRTDRGQRTDSFEVLNAGTPGMSVARMEEYWQRWIRHFEPDLVVVYPSPGFYLGTDAPPDSTTPPMAPAAEPGGGARLPSKVSAAVKRFLPQGLQAELKRVMVSRVRSAESEDWIWRDVPADRLALYVRHLHRLAATLKAAGVEVVLATHATAVTVPFDRTDRLLLSSEERFFPRAGPEVIVEFERRADEEVVRLGRELGIVVVDVDAAVPPDSRLFSDYEHFTDAGAELVADILAPPILEHARIGGAPTDAVGSRH
jgi:hypothetical protein